MKKRKQGTDERALLDKAAFRLLLTQTVVCAVIILLVWLWVLLGGKDVWLGNVCREGLQDNSLFEGISQRYYGTTVTTTTTVQPIVTEQPITTPSSTSTTGEPHVDD